MATSAGNSLVAFLFALLWTSIAGTPEEAPQFTTNFPFSLEFSNSSGGKLSCAARSVPEAKISWIFSDGSSINNVPGLRHVSLDGTLVFPSFKAEDYRPDVHSVVYSCTASNSVGTLTSNPIRVKGIVLQPFDVYVYDVYAIKGNSVVMRCHLPEFVIDYVQVNAWIRDSVVIISSAVFNITSKYVLLSNGDLLIRDVDESDGKSAFRCQATHRLTGETKTSLTRGKLIVTESKGRVPPKIITSKALQITNRDENIFIPCVATGFPIPTLRWHKQSSAGIMQAIISNGRHQLLFDGLFIKNTETVDSGIYICTATNDIGSDKIALEIKILENLMVHVKPKESKVDVGQFLSLYCHISGFPVSSITWMKNGQPLYLEGLDSSNNKTVTISKMSSSYSGIYQCFASNDRQVANGMAIVRLGDSLPLLKEVFKEKIVHPGESVTLECIAGGSPLPKIMWTLDHSEIRSSDRIEITVFKENSQQLISRLILTNVIIEDGGLYRCIAENKAGKVQHQARVNIFGEVGIRTDVKYSFTADSTAQVDCPFYGYPYTTISWEKNGITLPDNMYQNLRKNGTLFIININPIRDNGIYKCTVSTDYGKKQVGTVQVKVMVPPKITPFSFQEEQIREGTRARIQCVVSEGETPLKLTWLKDGVPFSSDLGVTIRDLDEFSSILMISAITPRHNGNYTCVASNAAGISHHTAHLFVNVLPKILPFAFQDDQFFKGMRAYIVCAASQGDLPIQFTWYKDHHPISPSLGVITRNIDTHANSLSIESVSSAHTGNYTCLAQNVAGMVFHTAQLLVHVIPRIIPFTFRNAMIEGNPARITCVIDQGDLPITIKWLKNTLDLSGIDGITTRSIDDYSSILTIERLHREHSGNYTCVASNAAASVTHTTSLIVQVPPKVVPFTFQEEHLLEGMLVRVSCVISRGDLPLTIQWLKDREPISDHLSVTIRDFDEYSSVLSIDPVSSKHSGNYTCIAKNHAGISTYSANLIVYVPPRWVIKPEDVTLKTGKSLTVDCKAEGFPEPTVIWKKVTGDNIFSDNKRIENMDNIQILFNNSLFFSEITKSDEGLYICMVTNDVGQPLSKVVKLKVKAAPVFRNTFVEIQAKKGNEVKIPCYADGDWPIAYTWSVNNQNIEENHRYKSEMTNENHRNISLLVIPWVDKKDSTMFDCKAENDMGQDEQKIKLIVQETPEAPAISLPIIVINQTVKLNWSIPYNGNSAILNYTVQFKKESDVWTNQFEELSVSGARTSAYITGLQPATVYAFRVFASNALGNGSLSEVVSIKMDDSIPNSAPKNVQIESIDANNVRVTWKPPSKDSWNGAITGYNIGYRIHGTRDDYVYNQLDVPEDYMEDLIYQLTHLEKFTEYDVIVQAFNSKGKGPSSEPVYVMTSEDVPTDHPHEVRCSSLSSKSIYILWESPSSRRVNGILRGFKVLYKKADEWFDAFLQQKIVDGTRATLNDLESNTNYSIQVVAFTKVGDGKRSPPVFCKTHEDIPEAPVAVKVLPSSSDAVVVSWKPSPIKTGNITRYNVFYTPLDHKKEIEDGTQMTEQILKDSTMVSSGPETQFLEISRLKKNQKYAFWVSATSAIGESPISSVVAQTVADAIIAAKSVAFDETILVRWKDSVLLPCQAVGIPSPQRKWMTGLKEIMENERISIRSDGSLLITKIGVEDNGNYTCTVYNEHGKDTIKYSLNVQVPPSAPILGVISKSHSSINLQWKTGPDGGDRIKGYLLHYKKDHESWITKEIRAEHGFYMLDGLACGATYQIYMEAFNSIGVGAPCNIITVSMEGARMEAPSKELFIREGPTFVTIHLDAWLFSGCPVENFGLEYKHHSSNEWIVVENGISPMQKKLVISGLTPASWYLLKVLVDSSGGTSVFEYDFSTLTLSGGTIPPDIFESKNPMYIFYMDPLMFIPAVILLLVVVIASVIVCVCMKSKKRKPRSHYEYSQSGSEMNTWTRHSRVMSVGSYGHSARDSTMSTDKNIDPSPYATSHLNDCYPEGVPTLSSVPFPPPPPPLPVFRQIQYPATSNEQVRRSEELHDTTFSLPSNFSTPQKDERNNDGYDPPPRAHMKEN